MQENGEERKWVGRVHAVLEAPLQRVWALASDGCGIHKWMPMVEECFPVQGEPGMSGFVRFLKGTMFPHPTGEASWIEERLLLMDPLHYKYAYCMEDGNIGLSGYINTVQFFDFGYNTTLVQWDYEVDPVIGANEEASLDYLAFLYKSSLKKLEFIAQFASQDPNTAIVEAQDASILPSSEETAVQPCPNSEVNEEQDLKTFTQQTSL